ncbi:uncharacterized protein [Watersipora subatra]|uniref:uncharacterized protein n=1 Tax=Watersipora subatra TaxID=2589382 RepID=UPI00355BE651
MEFNRKLFDDDIKKYGLEDINKQLKHLRSLAQSYKRTAIHSNHGAEKRWLPYVKAHGLINSCLARCSSQEIPILENQLFLLEQYWHGGKHPLKTIEKWREMKAEHRSRITEIRTDCQNRFQGCGTEIESINMDSLFGDKNKQLEARFANGVQKESKVCTAKMIEFAKLICDSSEKIVGIAKGPLPCDYAIIALGSIARGEATPYSDLEYAFLIENSSHQKYFEQIAVDTYFRMSNLGETTLKYYHITELQGFEDTGPCGFRIDGLTPKAGNIPTGNGLTEETLMLTVGELVDRYRQSLTAPPSAPGIGSLADLLSAIECVHHSIAGKKLIQEFLDQKKKVNNENRCLEKNLLTLVGDIEKYSEDFRPEDLQVDMRTLAIKANIFRYPTILAHDLKIVLNLDEHSAWDVFLELHKRSFISADLLASLQFILTSAIWIRTSAYLHTGKQKETITFHPMYDAQVANDRFYAPKKLYISMTCKLTPIKQKIINSLKERVSQPANLEYLQLVLQSLQTTNDDFLYQARLHYICGDHKGGLRCIQRALRDECATDDALKFVYAVGENCEYAVKLVAYLLFHDGQFDKAIGFFQQLCNMEKLGNNDCIKLASFQAAIGQCLVMMERYDDSRKEFDGAGGRIKHLFGLGKKKDIPRLLLSLAEWKPTKEQTDIVLFGCINNRFLADSVRYHQGRYHKVRNSFQNLTYSFLYLQHKMKDLSTQNLVVADFKVSFGLYHLEFAEFEQAENCLRSAYEIYKDAFGASAAVSDMSSIFLHLGTLAMMRAKYAEAQQFCEKSLDILIRSGQSTPFALLACHHSLAEVHLERGEPESSLEHIRSCLTVMESSITEKFVLRAALVKVTHARLIQQQAIQMPRSQQLDAITQAKTYLEQAIQSLREIVDKKSKESHPQILRAKRLNAQICLDLGETKQARSIALQCLDGALEARGKEKPHPDVLVSQILLAKVYLSFYETRSAESHLDTALSGLYQLYGQDCVRPELAEIFHIKSEVAAMQGQDAQAFELANQAVTMLKRVYGADAEHAIITQYEQLRDVMAGLCQAAIEN